MTLIKTKALNISGLNDEVLTKSYAILALAHGAIAMFNTRGISVCSFGITKLQSRYFAVFKNNLVQKINKAQ